jgi:hypothetical protein
VLGVTEVEPYREALGGGTFLGAFEERGDNVDPGDVAAASGGGDGGIP